MNRQQLDALCASLPGTTTDIKWGSDFCFCVAEKMYAVTSADEAGRALTLKSTAEGAAALAQREGITPAPYLARYNWVSIEDYSSMDSDELEMLVKASYQLVVSKLPKKKQRELLAPA